MPPADDDAADARLRVRKTYKLAIGGAFPRSESGRSYPVDDASGALLANAAQASRKDVRDAVVAARKAFPGLGRRDAVQPRAGDLPHRRDARRPSRAVRRRGRGRRGRVAGRRARARSDESIDRIVWYAGWADKFAQVAGSANPIAGPYFNFSLPEPTGVVAILAPQDSSLLGFVSALAPVLCTGNTAVIVASERRPLPAVSLAEVLATSDVPGGVANVLTGLTNELAPWLASHRDVNAIDLTGVAAVRARRAAARGGRQRQARLHPAGRGLGARARPRAADGLRRDEDRLAPDRGLSSDGGGSQLGVPAPLAAHDVLGDAHHRVHGEAMPSRTTRLLGGQLSSSSITDSAREAADRGADQLGCDDHAQRRP